MAKNVKMPRKPRRAGNPDRLEGFIGAPGPLRETHGTIGCPFLFIEKEKTAVSRIENHSRDIRLSTLEKVASAVGRSIEIKIR